MTTNDVVSTVCELRPEWKPHGVSIAIGKLRHARPDLTEATVLAIMTSVATNPTARTPNSALYHPLAVKQADPSRRDPAGIPVRTVLNQLERFHAAHTDAIRRVRNEGPATFDGDTCWRHEKRPVVAPYDECSECLDERHTANEWRETRGIPVQPPHRQEPVL
jgi:hypothetical protein